MFEIPFLKRLKQLFCRHNYYAVALTEHYQEPGNNGHEKVVVYKCIHCTHVQIIK